MPGGLEGGYQGFWSCPIVRMTDVRWSGYLSPSGGNQRVFWRSGVCPEVDKVLAQDRRVQKFAPG